MDKEEITDLALRYIDKEEIVDFPESDDLFCFLSREVPTDRILKDDEGWGFDGYGILSGYEKDHEAKPVGKWIWVSYIDLTLFPPSLQMLKLQPPHIAKGLYATPDRSRQIRIVKIDRHQNAGHTPEPEIPASAKKGGNIIQFPGVGQ